jgi:hypothetical protein
MYALLWSLGLQYHVRQVTVPRQEMIELRQLLEGPHLFAQNVLCLGQLHVQATIECKVDSPA